VRSSAASDVYKRQTFNGFLTAVFFGFEQKLPNAIIQKKGRVQNILFSDSETIFTNLEKAKRVWNVIRNKSNSAIKNIYFAYQSEHNQVESLLYHYIQKLMNTDSHNSLLFSDDAINKISQLAFKVGREKQIIESSVDFQITTDDVNFATIKPDFDILPLVSKHFRNKFPEREWLVYDIKRKYGLFYNLYGVEIISLNLKELHINSLSTNIFKKVAVKSYLNPKLHEQSVSKESWQYSQENKKVV